MVLDKITPKEIDQTLKIETDTDNERISYAEASYFVLRLHNVRQRLPDKKLYLNDAVIKKLVMELLPQFEYEKISRIAAIPEITLEYFKDGRDSNHVLGVTNCYNIKLNSRATSEISPWHGREMIFTIAHELAHLAQGIHICRNFPSDILETSAQLAALEVCAGLAAGGGEWFFRAFLTEIFEIGLMSALLCAFREKKMDDFNKLRRYVLPGEINESKFQRMFRQFKDEMYKLLLILDWYGLKPLELIFSALKKDLNIHGLAFPSTYVGYAEVKPMVLVIDDTEYILRNLEKIAEGFSEIK